MDQDHENREPRDKYIPPIFIDEDPNAEVEVFYRGLHNKKYVWMRGTILGVDDFQPLRQPLESDKSLDENQEKQIIGDFLRDYRSQYQEQINNFVDSCRRELEENAQPALAGLAKLMDYEWPEDSEGYRVVPVLLPYSPFGDNIFFYSILGAVWGKQQPSDLLFTSIHEISHMMMYEILERSHPDLVSRQDHVQLNISVDYLKEILAPVLMNQPSLSKFYDLSRYEKGYMGNPDIEKMYVISEGLDEKVQISRYFQQIFEKMKYQEHKSFPEILNYMVQIALPLEAEFKKRWDLWGEHHWELFDSPELLEEYTQPIKI